MAHLINVDAFFGHGTASAVFTFAMPGGCSARFEFSLENVAPDAWRRFQKGGGGIYFPSGSSIVLESVMRPNHYPIELVDNVRFTVAGPGPMLLLSYITVPHAVGMKAIDQFADILESEPRQAVEVPPPLRWIPSDLLRHQSLPPPAGPPLAGPPPAGLLPAGPPPASQPPVARRAGPPDQ